MVVLRDGSLFSPGWTFSFSTNSCDAGYGKVAAGVPIVVEVRKGAQVVASWPQNLQPSSPSLSGRSPRLNHREGERQGSQGAGGTFVSNECYRRGVTSAGSARESFAPIGSNLESYDNYFRPACRRHDVIFTKLNHE